MKKQIYTLFFLVIFSSLLIGQENTSLLCSDGIDNDEDGLIDCDDLECIQFFHNSCIICNEGSSYADEVIEYVPGCPISDPNPEGAVGLSDYQGGTIDEPEFVFLGQGGHLSLGFTNNVLINSGDSQIDFYVFEVGPAVEPCEIFLRPADIYTKAALQNAGFVESGIGFFKIGDIGGSTSGLDIDNDIPGYALGLLVFDAIKIKDIEDGGCSSVVPGADIDAVCAIYSKSLEICSDGIDNDGDGLVDCEDPDIANDCCCISDDISLLGITNSGYIIKIDTLTGSSKSLFKIENYKEFGPMTFDYQSNTLYLVADYKTEPMLLSINVLEQSIIEIGFIDIISPFQDLKLVEALEFDPKSNKLYASASNIAPPQNYFSNQMIEVNPINGGATFLYGFSNSCQNEADGIVISNNAAFFADGCPDPNDLHGIDLNTGQSWYIGSNANVFGNRSAIQPFSNKIYVINIDNRTLNIWDNGDASNQIIGVTHSDTDYEGSDIRELSFVKLCEKLNEKCNNNLDDDNDGLIDCEDPDIANDCCCKEALILDLGENIQVCEGDQLLLEADSLFATYLWGDGSTTSTIFATEQKWYHLTVTDECENISIDSVYLTVLNTKTTHLEYKICEGDSILINEKIYYDTGNYTQDLKNQYGCDSVLTIFISIIDRHEAMFQFDTVNCNNEFTFFTILEEPNDDVAWFLNGEYYSSLPSEVLTITESVAIELKLVLNPNTSCSDSMVSYYQLEYLPPIELINNNPGKLCLGEIITLYSNTNNGNRWILNGIDFGEENEISFNLLEPSFVKLYNVFQPCNDTIIISFDMTQRVPAVFTFDRLECPNQFILQNIPSSSNTDVLWLLDGEYFSINYNDTISIAESKPIKLTLITNPNTYCADTSSVIYDLKYTEPKDELYISPNIFSPNNDGINDFYCPLQYIDPDRKGNFLIFDRWGNLMFQSISFADCWDGKFDGRRVEEGVYTVKITIGELIDCGQVYKKVDGYQTITLIK